jgi:uncharacterized protein YbjT (DUF2867 family)
LSLRRLPSGIEKQAVSGINGFGRITDDGERLMLSIPLPHFSLVQNGPAARTSERSPEALQDAFVQELVGYIRNRALSDEECVTAIRAAIGRLPSP